MTLPDGQSFGSMTAPLEEVLPFTSAFQAVVRLRSENGEGFILSDEGNPVAAGYQDDDRALRGGAALEYLSAEPSLSSELSRYGPDEYALALAWCEEGGYVIGEEETTEPGTGEEHPPDADPGEGAIPELDREALNLVLSQPGVKAVSAFYEGFAVHSVGAADFERVAAISEDLLRASSRIAGDMEMGALDQIILETPGGKLIIAPVGDLSVCVLTKANANLGLVRIALKSLSWRG
ncbi:putative regulator of Ras-like GTPase activity (Roadblock/LC7/MglB family) [Methanofollis sp. W23]|uniref:roadblock/LC7 domain-containing protein n=1 Tax=Methanofollis sp. W23 TaxID=2817849 RepID=UPI001AE5A00E|nr:roadblock/LC7 domain-containing protein [Methanofollis sp. W23]MBP2145974.1 putative regulator of Ras-like GTPase activity (Roadblock/LC7/MglB family) [Methanofollis sp. W23]